MHNSSRPKKSLKPIPPTPHQVRHFNLLTFHFRSRASESSYLPSLELDHTVGAKKKKVSPCTKRIIRINQAILPLGTLLVQHTVTAVLAANLVAALQRDTGRALAAEVDDGGAVDGHGAGETAALSIEGVLGAHRGDLVGFARHF